MGRKPEQWSVKAVAGFWDLDDPSYYCERQNEPSKGASDYIDVWDVDHSAERILAIGNLSGEGLQRVLPVGPNDPAKVIELLASQGIFPDPAGSFEARKVRSILKLRRGRPAGKRTNPFRRGSFYASKAGEAATYMLNNDPPSEETNMVKLRSDLDRERRAYHEYADSKCACLLEAARAAAKKRWDEHDKWDRESKAHKASEESCRGEINRIISKIEQIRSDHAHRAFWDLWIDPLDPEDDKNQEDEPDGDPRTKERFRDLLMPAFMLGRETLHGEIQYWLQSTQTYLQECSLSPAVFAREMRFNRDLISRDARIRRKRLDAWKRVFWRAHRPSWKEIVEKGIPADTI